MTSRGPFQPKTFYDSVILSIVYWLVSRMQKAYFARKGRLFRCSWTCTPGVRLKTLSPRKVCWKVLKLHEVSNVL